MENINIQPDEDNSFEEEVTKGDFLEGYYQDEADHNDESDEGNAAKFEFVDESLNDIDFSQFSGDFKSSLKGIHGKIKNKKPIIKQRKVKRKHNIGVKSSVHINGKQHKRPISKVIIPSERSVIVEGVDKFMLSNDANVDSAKNIGYYKGKKLKEMTLTFSNNSAIDFNLEIFNPSNPLDYLYNTSQNINDKISLAGGVAASYTDILFYLLANPTLIANAKVVTTGSQVQAQQNVSFQFKNKNIHGEQRIVPLDLALSFDAYQYQSSIIYFDIMRDLNRPFIPDGMDVINYTVLAGNTVTICFYYKQISLKKFFFKEARDSKFLM